ncbi:MAG: hypothetical protein AAF903_12295 [Pseudomonadota bacterium]
MLATEIMRLTALELLCPTEALTGNRPFPTLAAGRVYDSAIIPVEALSEDDDFTPVLSLYSGEASGGTQRGAMGGDLLFTGVLDVVGELAVRADFSGDSDGGDLSMPLMSENDPDAQATLAALLAQARFAIERSPEGAAFRQVVMGLESIQMMPMAVADIDVRFLRTTMRMTFRMRDDCFDMTSGKPQHFEALLDRLPEGSPNFEKLTNLLTRFSPPVVGDLEVPDIVQAANYSGIKEPSAP